LTHNCPAQNELVFQGPTTTSVTTITTLRYVGELFPVNGTKGDFFA
jgi:hypothetical protein